MISICSGCSSCVSVCPKQAIRLEKNEKGFVTAKIDQTKCIDCSICEKVCPHTNGPFTGNDYSETILFKTSDKETYKSSSSGGAAFELYKHFLLNENAVSYGVKYDSSLKPVYSGATQEDELVLFSGSKYIQADLSDSFRNIISYLEVGKKVLFIGLPCIVEGLLLLLRSKKVRIDNLYTCDLICNGIGSPEVWNDYCKYVERKYKSKPINYNFRIKYVDGILAKDNNTHHTKVLLENGRIIPDTSIYAHIYKNLYFKKLIMSDACYNCKFASNKRVGDLSLADNNGYTGKNDEFKYTSLILINSIKGKYMVEQLKRNGQVMNISIDEVEQPHLKKPVLMPKESPLFWKRYRKYGFRFVASFYGGKNIVSYLRKFKKRIFHSKNGK